MSRFLVGLMLMVGLVVAGSERAARGKQPGGKGVDPVERLKTVVKGKPALVEVDPADLIAAGERIRPGRSTAVTDALVLGSRRARGASVVSVYADDVRALIDAAEAPPVEPPVPSGPPPVTVAEVEAKLAAARVESEQLRADRDAVAAKLMDADGRNRRWFAGTLLLLLLAAFVGSLVFRPRRPRP